MKKILAMVLALAMVLCLAACGSEEASSEAPADTAAQTEAQTEAGTEEATEEATEDAQAAAEPVNITVTVVNAGQFEVERLALTVEDANANGKLTIEDAMVCAHREYCDEGEAGFASVEGGDGMYITKLWGVENGGAYGYYLNDKMAMSLSDEIQAGDYLVIFAYKDAANYSDIYAWASLEMGEGDAVIFTLSGYTGWDADYNPIEGPISGASVYVDGTQIGDQTGDTLTDENGKVTLYLPKAEGKIFQVEFFNEEANIVPVVIYY